MIEYEICLRAILFHSVILIVSVREGVFTTNLNVHLNRDDLKEFKAILHYHDDDESSQFVTLHSKGITLYLSIAQAKSIRSSLAPSNLIKD
jgi:hypothetical protein|tara:strand:+ start:1122 stop:1394 length:273 start_codon:yes stop_codon:yes gene_type:complete